MNETMEGVGAEHPGGSGAWRPRLLPFCAGVLTLGLALACVEPTSTNSEASGVLGRIENYDAPPYPANEYVYRETWDARRESGAPNPPTKVDTLVADLVQKGGFSFMAREAVMSLTSHDFEAVIETYVEEDWSNIAGYRPWTHANFIRSLSGDERIQLAKEVALWLAEHGYNAPYRKPPVLEFN